MSPGSETLNKDPKQHLAQLLDEAKLHTTRLDEGALQWQYWPGPDDKLPLLLLHGGFGSWTHWIANLEALRQHRPLWTVDMPGLGSSGKMPKPQTVAHFCELILDGFDSLVGADAVFDIAGFSFGALVGSHVAAKAGTRCKHFIACGAAGFGELHVQVDLLKPPNEATPEVEADSIHRSNLRCLMFARSETIDDLAVYIHADNLAHARFNSRRLAKSDEFTKIIPQISAKLCGVWGSKDVTAGEMPGIVSREALFRAAQPNCAFHIMDRVGHWAMYEDAEGFNRIVIEELAE
jgi:pimeloyl-ACP methyl ester carboxylesterase